METCQPNGQRGWHVEGQEVRVERVGCKGEGSEDTKEGRKRQTTQDVHLYMCVCIRGVDRASNKKAKTKGQKQKKAKKKKARRC